MSNISKAFLPWTQQNKNILVEDKIWIKELVTLLSNHFVGNSNYQKN